MTKKGDYASLSQEQKDRKNAARRAKYNQDTEWRARKKSQYTYWRYGITSAERETLFDSQGRVCGCCGSSDPGGVHGWHLDHCHDSGEIRGILCQPCNTALGLAKHDVDRLLACAEYLVKFQNVLGEIQ